MVVARVGVEAEVSSRCVGVNAGWSACRCCLDVGAVGSSVAYRSARAMYFGVA